MSKDTDKLREVLTAYTAIIEFLLPFDGYTRRVILETAERMVESKLKAAAEKAKP